MNIYENISLLSISLGAAVMCVVVAGLYQHFVTLRYVRERLLSELATLPLTHVLALLGIPLKTYTRKTSWEMIGRHITACKNCQQHQQCQRCLERGECIFKANMCPNFSSLTKLSAKDRQGGF